MLSKNEKMPTCPVKQIRNIYKNTKALPDTAPLTLEYVLTACFPTVWSNVQAALNDQYTQGFIAGKESAKNEN